MNDNMIAALKRERAAYVAAGDDDRVRQVDEQLAHYGHAPAKSAVTDADGAPKGRTAGGGRRTADTDQGPGGDDGGKAAAKTAAVKKTAAPPQK